MKELKCAILGLVSCASVVSGLQECTNCEFTSVVDILSASAMFSSFVRILQKSGDIPLLNELQNYTLLAPVNTAFADEYGPENDVNFDIYNYILKDRVLESSEVGIGTEILYKGVKFPLDLRREESGTIKINDATVVEPDLTPNFQNATVHGISDLLLNPPNSRGLVSSLNEEGRETSIFHSFVEGISDFEQVTDRNTLLIPLDINFYKCFNHIEVNYLVDAFEELSSLHNSVSDAWIRDRQLFLRSLICHGLVGGKAAETRVVNNLNNQPVNFSVQDLGSCISVNGSSSSKKANMVFDRGIAHSFSDIPFLPNAFQFNAEKYLHGLNSTDFVKELHFRNLQHIIRDRHDNLTIFVPEVADGDSQGFTKSSLLYHFVEDQVWLEDEFKEVNSAHSLTKMFPSAFCSSNKRLGGNCQRLRIAKEGGSYSINEKYRISHAKPYQIGNTLIYTISEDLQLPGEFLSALNPFYHCSRSLSLLHQANLLNLPLNNKGYTVLLPCFDSWTDSELTYEYLRGNRTAVEVVTKSWLLQDLVYSDADNQTRELENMLDERVSLSTHSTSRRAKKVSFHLSNFVNGITVEKDLDLLFNQGVVHPLRDFQLPKAFSITLKDLIKTAGAYNFLQLLESIEYFASILDGDEPFSILVPTSGSLDLEGITQNSTNLKDFLKLHTVNGNLTQKLKSCDGSFSTLLGETLVCKENTPGTSWLKLDNGADHKVRVLRKGCSSSSNNSCVFLIDRPISLSWLREKRSHLQFPGIAVGAGILVGVVSMLAVLLCILLVLFGKSVKRPHAPASTDEADANQDTRPLLADGESLRRTPSSSQGHHQRFESTYSSHACVPAIDVTPK